MVKCKYAPLEQLTDAEIERGWVRYVCPEHGGLLAGPPKLTVICACGRKGRSAGT